MKSHPSLAVATMAIVFACGSPQSAWGDDAEIYARLVPPEASQPLVMFSLDLRSNVLTARKCQGPECDFLRSPNGGTLPATGTVSYFEVLRAALLHVLKPLSGIKIGLMLSHKDEGCDGGPPTSGICSNGGYIAMGFKPIEAGDENGNLAMFKSVLDTMPTDVQHPYQGRELFYELHSYLRGIEVWNGYHGLTSFDSNQVDSELLAIQDQINMNQQYAAIWEGTDSAPVHGFGADPGIIAGAVPSNTERGHYTDFGRYRSPLSQVDECSKIFTVNFMFGTSTFDGGPRAQNSQQRIFDTTGLSWNCQGQQCQFAEMIRHMNTTDHAPDVAGDQKVISYFLGEKSVLDDYARAGGTNSALALSDDPEELVATLTEVLKQILSVSTTFTAAALPVNSFDRSQVLSDVFLSLFQPQADLFATNKYWWGNLKKLKLSGIDSLGGTVELLDARGAGAVAVDGRVKFDALTFWTDPLGIDVLQADRDPDENAVSGRDGRSVNRGGSGQQIPGYLTTGPGLTNASGPRRMFYDAGPGTLADLDATADLAAALQTTMGATSTEEALDVLHFLRGYMPGIDPPQPMDWMFGSSMHSRPLPVNYGARGSHTRENPLIYVAVGGNDGGLRFVRNTDGSGNELGREAWSFTPAEVMSNMLRTVRLDGVVKAGETTIYGFDGSPTLYIDGDVDGTIVSPGVDAEENNVPGSTAILYAGLRRGGHGYYALDITDPEQPELLWRITPDTPGVDGARPFQNIGLTFSQPRVGRVNFGGTEGIRPVVVFGGGYDRIYDQRDTIPADGDGIKGKGIYVVDGLTGELIWHLTHDDMRDSIPSTVTAVDTIGDGLLDRLYVGDLGGRVWRVDMTPAGTPSDWTVSMLADLGRHAAGDSAGGFTDRRFFNAPDVVQSRLLFEDQGTITNFEFDAVLIGSGDRENPLDRQVSGVPQNWFFMIRDRNIAVLGASDDTAYVFDNLTDVTPNTGIQLPQSSAGWRLRLSAPGEKNLAPALTLANTVYFTTYLPPGASASLNCGPAEGTGRAYTVSLFNANPPLNRDQVIDPSATDLDADLRWVELKSGGIPAEVVLIPQAGKVMLPDFEMLDPPFATRWRTYWHVQEDPVQ